MFETNWYRTYVGYTSPVFWQSLKSGRCQNLHITLLWGSASFKAATLMLQFKKIAKFLKGAQLRSGLRPCLWEKVREKHKIPWPGQSLKKVILTLNFVFYKVTIFFVNYQSSHYQCNPGYIWKWSYRYWTDEGDRYFYIRRHRLYLKIIATDRCRLHVYCILAITQSASHCCTGYL